MDMASTLHHLNPTLMVAAISGLLFIEECGLPVPFAPGDLVLAIVGVLISTSSCKPLLLLASVTLSMAAGAVTGREIFAQVGHRLIGRLADAFHFRSSLDKIADRLRRRGWRAVLVGRLTPGLRIHTTQIAGLAGVSRLTFIAGLLPALAIQIALFTGAGALVGQPAIDFIRDAGHQVLPIAAAAAALTIVVLSARHRTQQVRSQRSSLHALSAQ